MIHVFKELGIATSKRSSSDSKLAGHYLPTYAKLAISLKMRVTCAQQQLPEGWTFENQKLCRDRPWNLWQHCCQ
jgi:hypothetical protein